MKRLIDGNDVAATLHQMIRQRENVKPGSTDAAFRSGLETALIIVELAEDEAMLRDGSEVLHCYSDALKNVTQVVPWGE